MKKEFCTYEQALALKELGFDEPCLLSLSWINGYNTYTEKSNEPKAWISSNVEIKYDFSQFKVDFKDVYHVEIQIPLYQQAFRWFRTKNIDSAIFEKHKDLGKFYGGYTKQESDNFGKSFGSNFKTYEEAESACLDKLIEIARNTKP